MLPLKMLIVAGDWTNEEKNAKPSGVMQKLAMSILSLKQKFAVLDLKNGGDYSTLLETYYHRINEYDVVLWFPNIPDKTLLDMGTDIKSKYPHILLITIGNNKKGKYSFEALVQKMRKTKSDLMIEMTEQEHAPNMYNFRLFDSQMNTFCSGSSVNRLALHLMKRINSLRSMTREKVYQSAKNRCEVINEYFGSSDENMTAIETADFLALTSEYSGTFAEITPEYSEERSIISCSLRPDKTSSCLDKIRPVFVSPKNFDIRLMQTALFVPVYMQNKRVRYCGDNNNKPSDDAAVQTRLYEALPEIHFMIRSNCYLSESSDYPTPFTESMNLYGTAEEVDEILKTIDKTYHSRNMNHYYINLKGRGSIIMGNSVENITGLSFVSRFSPDFDQTDII